MKPSSALIIGGAYLSYTIASWSTERREAVVQMIKDGGAGAVNACLELHKLLARYERRVWSRHNFAHDLNDGFDSCHSAPIARWP